MCYDCIFGYRDFKMVLKLFVILKFFGFRLGDLIVLNNVVCEEEMMLLRRFVDIELSFLLLFWYQVFMINGWNLIVWLGGLDYVLVKIMVFLKNIYYDVNIEFLIEKMKFGLEVCLISVFFCILKQFVVDFKVVWFCRNIRNNFF